MGGGGRGTIFETPAYTAQAPRASRLGVAVTVAGLATIFGALLLCAARVFGDISALLGISDEGPVRFIPALVFAPFLFLFAIPVTVLFCRARYQNWQRALKVAGVALFFCAGLAFLPVILPFFILFWCIPADILHGMPGVPGGAYVGVAMQVGFGVVLLLLSRPRRGREADGC